MPYNIIPIAIILFSLLIIIVIIVKKFPRLTMIDVDTITEERNIKTKEKIIQERIERQLKNFFGKISPSLKNLTNDTQKFFKSLYKRIQKLEKKFEDTKKSTLGEGVALVDKKIQKYLAEAEEYFDEKDYKDAEEKYIDVISRDAKNVEAYRGLIKIYLALGDEEKVVETSLYLIKILQDDNERADVLCQLGCFFVKNKDYKKAIKYFQKACGQQENNPKYLDYLLDAGINDENKDLSLSTFEKLHAVNPENQKLGEYKEKIEKLIVKQGQL